MRNLGKLVICIITCEMVGIISGLLTIKTIPSWYASLAKPFFSPPNWIFGPVWSALYFIMGVSLFLVWKKRLEKEQNKAALNIFYIQLGLNFLWSLLFFGLRSPILGLIDIIILWYFIFLTMQKFYKISKNASYLLIPYLAWVSFAAILNLSIFILNL